MPMPPFAQRNERGWHLLVPSAMQDHSGEQSLDDEIRLLPNCEIDHREQVGGLDQLVELLEPTLTGVQNLDQIHASGCLPSLCKRDDPLPGLLWECDNRRVALLLRHQSELTEEPQQPVLLRCLSHSLQRTVSAGHRSNATPGSYAVSVSRLVSRLRNVLAGRALGKAGFWRALWGGTGAGIPRGARAAQPARAPPAAPPRGR